MSIACLRKLVVSGAALVLSSGITILTGCGLGPVTGAGDSVSESVSISGAHIHGKVHGGVYPIQGANIELWQTSVGTWNTTTSSYAPSFYGSTSTNTGFIASTTSAKAGDNSGRAPGYFDFGTQTLTCTAGNYVYLTTTGGGTIPSKANSNVIQVAVIGHCPASASQAAYFNNVNVFLSETSTVAAAYTLGNFISIDTDPNTSLQRVNIAAPVDNTATGSCPVANGAMTCTAAGLAHGFGNAINLVDFVTFDGSFPSGAARAALPANSKALAPQAMVNTLGNVLQSCVDSGPSTVSTPSSPCKTLLGYSPTSAAGTAPTNTLQVALNIAANPTSNVTTLYGLQSANSPFTPMMSAAPTAFSLAIFYPAAAIGDTAFTAPADVALDAQDNIYVAYSQGSNGAVAELSAAGTPVFSGAKPAVATNFTNPGTLAIDPSGYVWVADDSPSATASNAGNVFGFTTSVTSAANKVGQSYQMYTVPHGNASGIAFDAAGDAFITRDATDKNINDYFYATGKTSYTQAGTFTGATLLRAQVDSYGTFKAVGDTTFLTFAPYPCKTGYAESSVTLDTKGGFALAIDNTANVYNTFLPIYKELATANVTQQGNQRCWTATTTVNDYAGSMTTDSIPSAAALDGNGNLFWSGTAGRLYSYLGAETNVTTTGGTLAGTPTYFYPCYLGSATSCTYPTSLAGMAIDSSGAMWYAAPNVGGTPYLVQHFGLAQPTWPLLAYAQSGVAF